MAPRESRFDTCLRSTVEQRAGLRALAVAVSYAASPPLLTVAATLLVASRLHRDAAVIWAAGFVGLGVVLPFVYVARQVRRGEIGDLELTRRRERTWPLMLTAGSLSLAGVVLDLGGAPLPLVNLAVLVALLALALLLVTRYWKISVHSAMAGAVGVLAWMTTGQPVPALVLVAAMAWSRLYLRRHTPNQVVAGAALGIGLGLAFGPTVLG
jgi:membrane-associated phospholipid phosphatase